VASKLRLGGRGGFTLIEVLAAMLILAVGLLALQGLALTAMRLVHRSKVQTEHLSMATQTLEATLSRARDGQNPGNATSSFVVNGTSDQLRVITAATAVPNTLPARTRWDVVVTVVPGTRAYLGPQDSTRLEGSVIR
jgi:type IV pilus modification protein PilV